jgi:hypothetical protein
LIWIVVGCLKKLLVAWIDSRKYCPLLDLCIIPLSFSLSHFSLCHLACLPCCAVQCPCVARSGSTTVLSRPWGRSASRSSQPASTRCMGRSMHRCVKAPAPTSVVQCMRKPLQTQLADPWTGQSIWFGLELLMWLCSQSRCMVGPGSSTAVYVSRSSRCWYWPAVWDGLCGGSPQQWSFAASSIHVGHCTHGAASWCATQLPPRFLGGSILSQAACWLQGAC